MAKQYEYAVTIPLVGFVELTVESATELSDEEAYYAALELDGASHPEKFADHWEFELVDHVTQGNVCYAPRNDVEVELVDVTEDDD